MKKVIAALLSLLALVVSWFPMNRAHAAPLSAQIESSDVVVEAQAGCSCAACVAAAKVQTVQTQVGCSCSTCTAATLGLNQSWR